MKVALITGGSRGIGAAVVREFAAAGYAVAFTYCSGEHSAEALAAAVTQSGGKALAMQADVRDFARAQEVVKESQQVLGPINVLINNAGIRRDRALHNMDPALWQEVMDTNLTGMFNYSRAIIGEMIRRGGVILNMSSVSGLIGIAGQTNYSASKAGMIGFTKALSREVARFGVRVNALAPGAIETEMTATMDEAARKKLLANVPMGGLGTPQQVARLALYLANEDAGYITGQVFTMDGGLS
ncbi:MAG: 3-oxoacyl-ACP reductase FabG [Acidobacteria bacterium]|nr:3-oxoacyl-ACP reductase FabG [Acidobacteriota bacterium]